MLQRLRRKRVLSVLLIIIGTTAFHLLAPTTSHAWHNLHLLAERLYYLPILLAAAWFGFRATSAFTLLISGAYALHFTLDWGSRPWVQMEQAANLVTFWVLAATASVLFGRWKSALGRVERSHEETLSTLAASLELREPYTAGHSERVRAYTLLLADKLGIREPERLRLLAAGALFHDVGKIGIPDTILMKAGPLTPDERTTMQRHPELGADLVGKIRFLEDARNLVLHHHENFDGRGYPHGLRGQDIPLGARLFAVADSYDAMTTTRSYRPALSVAEAAQRILEGRGTQFDPEVVDAFIGIGIQTWRDLAVQYGVPHPLQPSLECSEGERHA